jgi:WbqC-like protein family
MTTVAVMQPYFLPYAGYFRLFAAADRVALFDCVQFPRRGWVHRNRLPNAAGDPAWLTLPLQRAAVDARISDLRFADDALERLQASSRRFPVLNSCRHPLCDAMLRLDGTVCDYLEKLLGFCCRTLDLPFETVRTSTLGLDPSLHGQDRVLAAARALGATRYVNLEGGRTLYDAAAFGDHGIELRFLPEWRGSRWSILHRILTEPAEIIAGDIRSQI